MVSIQTRAMLGWEERLDDDSEWHDTQSRIIRSMVPDRAKIWSAEAEFIYIDRVPNVGVRGRFPCRRKQEAVIA